VLVDATFEDDVENEFGVVEDESDRNRNGFDIADLLFKK
jgi:hypothetical protein